LKGRRGWTVIVVGALMCLIIAGVRGAATPSVDERVDAISKVLACPICNGESVFESRNAQSAALRTEIRTQVEQGRTDGEIIAYLQARSDQDLTLLPDGSGLSATVWVIPALVLVAAVAILLVVFRRWRAERRATATAADEELVAAALAAQDAR
jgi:cytochrome c-type biogenesis protein CcmH